MRNAGRQMNIVVIGHGMVGHKFLEQLHALGVADANVTVLCEDCLLYTSPSPRD